MMPWKGNAKGQMQKARKYKANIFPLKAGRAVNNTTNRILTFYIINPSATKKPGKSNPVLVGKLEL